MELKNQDSEELCFRFLPAAACSAEQLVSVYGHEQRKRQLQRIRALLTNESAVDCFFMTAERKGKTIALLQLCRQRQRPQRFRIRGLHCNSRFRCQGLATRLLQQGIHQVFGQCRGEEVLSFILPTNCASITAHERAGFHRCPKLPAIILPKRHLCLVRMREGCDR